MRIGLFQNVQWPEGTEQVTQFQNAVDQTLRAEQLGFNSAWFVEHHWTRHGILSSTLGVLGYLAGRTSTIRLGTAVLVLPFHEPARLVEEASTVDVLSGGRLDLGVGRGFQWSEFHGFNVSMDESQARYDESVDIILKSWRTPGRFSYAGQFWSYNDVSVEPHPLQQPHPPVWAAVSSVETATKVGRQGLNLLMSSGVSLRRAPELIAAYREGLAEAGLEFTPEHVTISRMFHIAETRERAWEIMGPPLKWFFETVTSVSRKPGADATPSRAFAPVPRLTGAIGSGEGDPGMLICTPDEATSVIKDLEAMGVGQVILQGNLGGIAQADYLRSIELVAHEIIPNFAGATSAV